MIGRKKELQYLTRGFSLGNALRSVFLYGCDGIGKSHLVREVAESLTLRNPAHLVFLAQGSEINRIQDIISSFGRNLHPSNRIPHPLLNEFGRKLGEEIIQTESQHRIDNTKIDLPESLAKKFVSVWENILSSSEINHLDFTPILVFEDMDKMPIDVLNWLCKDFNHAIRKSKVFQNTRFLFTSTQRKSVYESFFSQFGISQIEEIEVQPLNPSEAVLLAESSGIEFTDPQSLILETEGVPLKILKFVNKSITVTNNSVKDMNENDQNEPSKFDDFSEKELGFLLHASYPTRINRYNLEFFCSARDAAFCFNWLKRRKDLVQSTADGDLLLNADLRQKMRDFHAQEAPQEAEKMSILASVLDAFIDRFPNPNLHWIPINLQVFNACTIDLCKKVFNEVEVEEITEFIDTHQEQFQINQNFFSLDEEAKLVTRRFMEVSDSECMEGLTEKVIKQWENDQNRAEKKKAKMLTEQENFKSEITEIDEQIQSFAQLKENILDNFKRPPSTKPKKSLFFWQLSHPDCAWIGNRGSKPIFGKFGFIPRSLRTCSYSVWFFLAKCRRSQTQDTRSWSGAKTCNRNPASFP